MRDQDFVPARQEGPRFRRAGPRTEVWTCGPDSKKTVGSGKGDRKGARRDVASHPVLSHQAADPVACAGGEFQTTEVKE